MSTCIHPLDSEEHPDQLINVANGFLGPTFINVDQAIAIAGAQVVEFELSLPHGYWNAIEKRVKTMASGKKGTKVGSQAIYETELIFSRVMGLHATAINVDFKDVFCFELAALPTALFHDMGAMRMCSSKSELKNKSRVEISSRNAHQINCTILDGCAIMWIVPWPSSSQTKAALVSDYVSAFKAYFKRQLEHGDVDLDFDKYMDFSTKSLARNERTTSYRLYKLTYSSPLSSQSSILNVHQN